MPCTREATLVHMIDNLGGRLGSFDRIEKELAPGTRWSGFDRAIGGGAFFAARAPADRPAEQEAQTDGVQIGGTEVIEPPLEVGAQISLSDAPAREAA